MAGHTHLTDWERSGVVGGILLHGKDGMAGGSGTKGRGKASIVQGTLCSPICSFICQDQLLVLAVFLSCPLERGGSQLERDARGYALSPLCGETHGGLERLSAGAERKKAWVWGRRETGDDKSQSSHVSFSVLKGWDLPPGLSSLSDALRYLR
ncbi:hypothetical protein Q8A73_014728 [Channa argus]|nr:hypothetical protein Q8A73_014728 [Channa argus]